MAGAFTVLSFGDLGEPDLTYVEYPWGAVHVEHEAEVAGARPVFDRLRSAALSPADSIELIRRVAQQL